MVRWVSRTAELVEADQHLVDEEWVQYQAFPTRRSSKKPIIFSPCIAFSLSVTFIAMVRGVLRYSCWNGTGTGIKGTSGPAGHVRGFFGRGYCEQRNK